MCALSGHKGNVNALEEGCVGFTARILARCNRCHLRIDHKLHQLHAAETRRKRLEASGQQALFGEGL